MNEQDLKDWDEHFKSSKREMEKMGLGIDGFREWFRILKYLCKKQKKLISGRRMSKEILEDTNKQEIIIFKVDPKKLSKVDLLKNNKQIIFPFQNVFLEFPYIIKRENFVGVSPGVLFQKKGNLIVGSYCWSIHNFITGNISYRISHIGFKEKEACGLIEEVDRENYHTEDGFNWGYLTASESIKLIKNFIAAIDKKEYTFYKKWKPSGYETKEIIYTRDVKSHKRHFWEDSGRFKIPLMSKEELDSKGYGIDEIVFRDGELRRDVPYRVIDQFTIGKEKEKERQEDNRRIILLEKRIFRQENKLGMILHELFPNEFIKKHDRKKLKGLELDFWIYKLNLAFEYDGEQHFDRKLCEEVFKSDFDALKKRDKKKDHLCRNKHITLIRIKYDEPLNKTHIKKKIKSINPSLLL